MAGTKNAAETLIDSILGDANPGDDGTQDEGGGGNTELFDPADDPELDTSPVSKDVRQQEQDDDTDEQPDDNDEPDAGDDAPADDDPLAKQAREARQRREPDEQEQDNRGKGPAQNEDLFHPNAQLKRDKAGNVYHNGKVIARAGREARNFFGWRKQAVADRQAATNLANRVNELALGARELFARYDQLQKQKTMFDTANMTPQEQTQALALMQAYKKNPIDGIKLMLTQAHMAGVDIKSITGGTGGLDPVALMQQFESKVTELLKPVLAETSERANQNSVRKEAEGFFDRNPRAKAVAKAVGGSHKLGQLLNEAKAKAPDLSLDELFERLDYALLRQFNGKLPNQDTGPVSRNGDRRTTRSQDRNMNRNFKRSVDSKNPNPSFDEIGQSVLRDIKLAEARGQ